MLFEALVTKVPINITDYHGTWLGGVTLCV